MAIIAHHPLTPRPGLLGGLRLQNYTNIVIIWLSITKNFQSIVIRFRVTPNTAKSDLRKLTEKGYLSEISMNGRTEGYIRSVNFERLIGKIR